MGQPITWRNVEGPSFTDASRMMAQAQAGINSGLEGVNKVLQNERATADANWDVQKANNTQAFLNSINQYRTPEDYQAALASGALDAGQYGAQIDQAAARSALDGRLAILQDRATKANQFQDQKQERDARPIVNQLNMMALSEDKDVRKSAKEALGIYAGNGMVPNAAEVAGNIRTAEHQNVTWDQESQKFTDELLTNKARRGLLGAQTNQANAAADHYRTESSSSTATLKSQLAESKAQKAAAELLIKNSPLDAGTVNSYEGKIKFMEGLKKLGVSGDQADSVYKEFATQFGNGVRVGVGADGADVRIGLPVSTALAAVEAAGPDAALRPNWLIGSGRGNRAVDRVGKLMAEPAYVTSLQEALQAQGIQYRPLHGSSEDAPSKVSASASVSRRSILPRPSDDMESGGALVNQAVQARLEKAKGMMTPQELEDAKTGKIPFRIKRYLEEANQR